MAVTPIYDVVIAGGGLAGLIAAISLSRSQHSVLLLEKKDYPFHKVCGEYVSNEVLNYLQSLGFDPFAYGASAISKLRVSTPQGKNYHVPLGLGGFGISRYTMDDALHKLALASGAAVKTQTRVSNIRLENNLFKIDTFEGGQFMAKIVIAAHGKRDMLDKKLERGFINRHTGYMGVKYHIKTDYPANEIGLDNFRNGYCGITRIEQDIYNLCYLYKKSPAISFKSIPELEAAVLHKNPVLKSIFHNSDFLSGKPEVINEICFDRKEPVKDNILMCGDSAGLITPLCGNGMAMAITAGKELSGLIAESGLCRKDVITTADRTQLAQRYSAAWSSLFSRRLFWGRVIQKSFGNPLVTGLFIGAAYHSPFKNWLIRQTHGKPVTT